MRADLPLPRDDQPAEAGDVLLRVRGTVQGVGFRPFVHRAAAGLNLRGWVRNDSQGVLIRAAGPLAAIAALRRALETGAPPAARVEAIETALPGPATAPAPLGFLIAASDGSGGGLETAIPPDLALCPACRAELLAPADRRHRYPFINCTQCGPRYSILERLPYDRSRTTMRAFRMCPACQAEYDDAGSRRHHAEPNACPVCGPAMFLTLPSGEEIRGEAALAGAAGILRAGGILAVKGIGGYHLMADAASAAAVATLRGRKAREEKPLAVMFPDLAAVRTAARVTPEAAALLASPAAPIVLLPRLPTAPLADGIAPGNPWIGALLPYAPLQVLLLAAFGGPLVATSANLAEEPLCFDRHDAQRRLAGMVDGFLEHNRRIVHPVDDSVVRLAAAGPVRLRRARGYAPSPLTLPAELAGSWLCAGAQMKSTVGVAAGNRLVLSPHLGDLEGAATRRVYDRTVAMLADLQGSPFTAVACDRHPDYASTRYAESLGLPCLPVQHHLAHVLACLLENGQDADDVLGVSWDGTGYGEDGTIWGGEFLLLRARQATRFARLRPFRLPGGAAAIRDGRRTALALVHAAQDRRYDEVADALGLRAAADTLRRMLDQGIQSPVTTSAGRLFDAVGALLGLGGANRFEGQTPLAVEAAATAAARSTRELPAVLRAVERGGGAAFELDWGPWIEAILRGRARGEAAAGLAAAFHRGLAAGIVAVARQAGAGTVALSGGCFQNVLLLDLAAGALRDAGFRVLLHRELPPNDGNIAAGQALGALWGLATVRLP
jgi:hydrogenase maturation protein HypF